MQRNPYTPPDAEVRDPAAHRVGPTWKAVLYGFLTDIAGTTLAGIAITTLWPGLVVPQGMTTEEAAKLAQPSEGFMLVSLLVGLACTTLGGYVAARISNQRVYWHAFLVGLLSLIFGELMLAWSTEPYPLGHRVIGDLLVIPAALLGAHLYLTSRAQRGARTAQ